MSKTGRYNISWRWPAITREIIFLVFISLPVLATLPDYGITFDEPIYMEASREIGKWTSLGTKEIFAREKIDRYWKTDPIRNVHPSGVKWLYLVAKKTVFWEDDPYTQNRVLSILIFSLSLIIFMRWWGGDSFLRGALFIILILLMPRFFAHLHFSATDIPMLSFHLFFIVALDRCFLRQGFWIAGILFGIMITFKITATLFAFPLLTVFLIWNREQWKNSIFQIALICLIGFGVFYILNPDWWHAPLSRGREFIFQTMTRRDWTPFTVYFGGQFYHYRAPFYYPFTMFFITTPLFHSFLLFSGLFFVFTDPRHRFNLKVWLILICLFVPFLILSLPISPAHDGIRYLLPALPFAVCFMTLGLERLWKTLKGHARNSLFDKIIGWVFAGFGLFLFAGDLNTPGRVPPHELSFYNKMVGGLSGAHYRGYETTYWYEIMNGEVLNRLNELCAGSTVYFPLSPTDLYFKDMSADGRIKFQIAPSPMEADFMLIFGRPFVRFWERKLLPQFQQEEKRPIHIWDITVDAIPLMKLYKIQSHPKATYGK